MKILAMAALSAMLTLAACGGGDTEDEKSAKGDETSAEATPTPTETPVETPAAAPKVSLATSCSILIPGTGKGPLEHVQMLMGGVALSQTQVDKIEGALDTIATITETAQPDLSAQLVALSGQAELFLADAYDPEAPARDTTPYKTAGIEIANICLGVL